MSAEKIIEQIKKDVQKEVKEILKEAEKQANNIISDSKKEAEEQAEKILSDGKKQSEKIRKILVSKANQDTKKEIDLDYCKKANIPVMRREVGGGATFLDEDQIFYQVIWNKKNRRFPKRIDEIFEFLSQPPCETYREFGIDAHFRAANDIVTKQGKKIAGEGGGDIEDSMVLVGGILMDFDFGAMSKILKVPDEKLVFIRPESME